MTTLSCSASALVVVAIALGTGCGADASPAADTDAGFSSTGNTGASESSVGDSSDGAATGATSGDEASGGPVGANRVLYLHFDGGTFVAGPEDAALDQPGNIGMPGPYPPAPEYTNRAVIIAAITDALEPFAVEVTDVRPDDGDYDMVVFTEGIGAATAIASSDCGDVNPRDVGIVYVHGNPQQEASSALAVFGQSIGLELVEGDDAMSYVNYSVLSFTDACLPIEVPTGCAHPQCPAGQQNSFAQLLEVVGPRG